MSKKKVQPCPVCREPIKSSVRSIVLDSYIDKMVEHLTDEVKDLRRTLIAEREGELNFIVATHIWLTLKVVCIALIGIIYNKGKGVL